MNVANALLDVLLALAQHLINANHAKQTMLSLIVMDNVIQHALLILGKMDNNAVLAHLVAMNVLIHPLV